jgi:hypothetical protein
LVTHPKISVAAFYSAKHPCPTDRVPYLIIMHSHAPVAVSPTQARGVANEKSSALLDPLCRKERIHTGQVHSLHLVFRNDHRNEQANVVFSIENTDSFRIFLQKDRLDAILDRSSDMGDLDQRTIRIRNAYQSPPPCMLRRVSPAPPNDLVYSSNRTPLDKSGNCTS